MTATDEQRETDQRKTVAKLIEGGSVALVTTVAEDGSLVSRPLALLERPFDGQLWFFTQDPSPKTDQVRANNQVNVAIQNGQNFISISGTATVSRDQSMIDELWNPHAEAWFENGKDDPTVAMLRVDADSAEYWSLDSPTLVAGIKYAAAIVTGKKPDVATNETVEL